MFKIDILWIVVLFLVVLPMLKQWALVRSRVMAIRNLEKIRGSRVITLIHRQESVGFLGMFARNYINIEDSEELLRAIRLTSPDMPIDLIVHTPGGLLLAASQIAAALNKHPSRVTVFVPHYAMSGGTLIALAADEIVMDRHAVLGPVDPQIGQYPAVSILKTVAEKPVAEVDDETLILADISRKAIAQTHKFVVNLLVDNIPREEAERLAQILLDDIGRHRKIRLRRQGDLTQVLVFRDLVRLHGLMRRQRHDARGDIGRCVRAMYTNAVRRLDDRKIVLCRKDHMREDAQVLHEPRA